MDSTLRKFAQEGQKVKRFTLNRNGKSLIVKPKNDETFVIMEDYLGDRCILWVCCYANGKEIWRHNINDIARITFDCN